jgi:hypothetical protein
MGHENSTIWGWEDIMTSRLCVYKIPIPVSPILFLIFCSPATVDDQAVQYKIPISVKRVIEKRGQVLLLTSDYI